MPRVQATCPHAFADTCECRRLLDAWNTAPPPSIVCQHTMGLTVRRWDEQQAAAVESALTTTMTGLRPLSSKALKGADPELAQAMSGLSRYVAERDLLTRWPFPVDGSHLFLILHQWVQDDANETLANQMAGNPAWLAAMAMFTDRLKRPARTFVIHSETDSDISVTVPPKPVHESITAMSTGAIEDLVDDIRSVLARCLFPVTPATLGYSLVRIIGDDNIELLPSHLQRLVLRRNADDRPLPARAVHLETHLFTALDLAEDDDGALSNDQPVWLVQPNAQFRLTADAALVTGPFIKDKLAKAMIAHREFVTNMAKHPLSDIHAIRKAQAGTFLQLSREYDPKDYVAEALHEARSKRAVLRGLAPEWELNRALDDLLDKVQKRVAQRRKRSGWSLTPDKGWRREARTRIEQDLQS